MKKTKLLIAAPVALAIAAPVIALTGCNTTVSIGAPDVTCTNKKASLKSGETVTFNFTLSKELPTGVTLKQVFVTTTSGEDSVFARIDDEHPTITDKKVSVVFGCSREMTAGAKQTSNISFVFTNGKSDERKLVEGFEFTYKA